MVTSFSKHWLSVVVLGSWAAIAQALPPIGKEIKFNPKVVPAAQAEQFKHGMKLILTLKNKDRVIGTLVWADEDADYMMIRTRAGTLPRKIPGKDIVNIDRIRAVNSAGNVIADMPEIHKVTVVNGNKSAVQYFAPALSSSEKNYLSQMENAENEVAQAEYLTTVTMNYLKGERTLQDQQNQMMSLNLEQQVNFSNYYPGPPYIYGLYSYGSYYPLLGGYGGTVYNPGIGGYGIGGYGMGGYGMGGGASRAPSSSLFETVMTRDLTLGKMLAKARQDLTIAQTHGLYEGGELVAIRTESQGVQPAVSK